ncbi:DUF397 domain-containing protein [Streptosporangium sp. G11]
MSQKEVVDPVWGDLIWRKSSCSGSGDNCVEVAALPGGGQIVSCPVTER